MRTIPPLRSLIVHGVVATALATLAVPAARAVDYPSTVLSDGPLAYYRLTGTSAPPAVAINSGSLGAAGNGLHGPRVLYRVAGALLGDDNLAAAYSGDGGARHTYIPYKAALNPPANQPFSVEFWANPSAEVNDSTGPCPLFNRVSSGNRSGWVFFQRSPGAGWNFRMYNGNGSSTGIDLTGGWNAQGAWSHVVAVWDGSAASLYVNGTLVAGPTVAAGGYNASTSATFSIGSYDDGAQNPFNGAIDEVAFYPSALSATQIADHYYTAQSYSPATPYRALVIADRAVEYLRLDEADPNAEIAVNSGSLGRAGEGTHFPGMAHQVPGALAGSSDTAAGYSAIDPVSCDGAVPTRVPFKPELNTGTFTIEAWLKPTLEGTSNAQCPLYNRREDSPRTGWAIYQRDHATGWNFRAYNGVNTDRSIDLTGGPYTIGAWNHLAVTFDGTVSTLYVNGVAVKSQTVVGSYVPNADTIVLGVGGFSDGFQNPFTGSIDEVALYSTALTAGQVLAHYQNGTNASRSTPYETLVTGDGAVEYLRLNEPVKQVAANLGTLATGADGFYVNTTNFPAGPQAPGYAGLEATNLAPEFNGNNTYIELLNPAGLNFSGPITLEAWVQPAASQNSEAYIIAHGGNDDWSRELELRIENGVYQIMSYNGTGHGASFAVPAEDLGSGTWVHLAGTYDGANWNLYRNGLLVASAADAVGALPVDNANWAIGARGRWKKGANFPTGGQERQFTGLIDEAAIYNYALSPSRVAAHFSAGVYGLHPLSAERAANTVKLTWSVGTLQEADAVTGPYTDVTGATSPYTAPAGAKKFYRLRF